MPGDRAAATGVETHATRKVAIGGGQDRGAAAAARRPRGQMTISGAAREAATKPEVAKPEVARRRCASVMHRGRR